VRTLVPPLAGAVPVSVVLAAGSLRADKNGLMLAVDARPCGRQGGFHVTVTHAEQQDMPSRSGRALRAEVGDTIVIEETAAGVPRTGQVVALTNPTGRLRTLCTGWRGNTSRCSFLALPHVSRRGTDPRKVVGPGHQGRSAPGPPLPGATPVAGAPSPVTPRPARPSGQGRLGPSRAPDFPAALVAVRQRNSQAKGAILGRISSGSRSGHDLHGIGLWPGRQVSGRDDFDLVGTSLGWAADEYGWGGRTCPR
jgi:hypothetical protein